MKPHQLIDFLSDQKPLEVVATNSNTGFFKDIVDNNFNTVK